MKINMGTVEMSDEQREQLANVLDGKTSKRKATRVEAKEFVWSYGDTWAETLTDMLRDQEDGDPTEGEDSDEDDDDLIGDEADDDGDDLDDLL